MARKKRPKSAAKLGRNHEAHAEHVEKRKRSEREQEEYDNWGLIHLHIILAALGLFVHFPFCTLNIVLGFTRLGPYAIGEKWWHWTRRHRRYAWLSVLQFVLHTLVIVLPRLR